LGNKRLVTTLLYRGSDHGWTGKDFHSRSDSKGATISLFKVKGGDCIGGFTKALWRSPIDPDFVGDNDAMLFNLSRYRHFPSKKTKYAIFRRYDWGPCFCGADYGRDL
jgi:hypothetical protein